MLLNQYLIDSNRLGILGAPLCSALLVSSCVFLQEESFFHKASDTGRIYGLIHHLDERIRAFSISRTLKFRGCYLRRSASACRRAKSNLKNMEFFLVSFATSPRCITEKASRSLKDLRRASHIKITLNTISSMKHDVCFKPIYRSSLMQ